LLLGDALLVAGADVGLLLARRARRRLGVGGLRVLNGLDLLDHGLQTFGAEFFVSLHRLHDELEVRIDLVPVGVGLFDAENVGHRELVELDSLARFIDPTHLHGNPQRGVDILPAEDVALQRQKGHLVLPVGTAVDGEGRRHVDHCQKGDGREDQPKGLALEILPHATDEADAPFDDVRHFYISTCCNE